MKYPLDDEKYNRDARSQRMTPVVPDGCYVYVRDIDGIIYVLSDGQHVHPRVLGGAKPATYAGDLTKRGIVITDLTNLSGTFQFDDAAGLLAVAEALEAAGLIIQTGAVRLFSHTAHQRAQILR